MGSDLRDRFQGIGGEPPRPPRKGDSAMVGSHTKWSHIPKRTEQPPRGAEAPAASCWPRPCQRLTPKHAGRHHPGDSLPPWKACRSSSRSLSPPHPPDPIPSRPSSCLPPTSGGQDLLHGRGAARKPRGRAAPGARMAGRALSLTFFPDIRAPCSGAPGGRRGSLWSPCVSPSRRAETGVGRATGGRASAGLRSQQAPDHSSVCLASPAPDPLPA